MPWAGAHRRGQFDFLMSLKRGWQAMTGKTTGCCLASYSAPWVRLEAVTLGPFHRRGIKRW